jgi:hypothetical protein
MKALASAAASAVLVLSAGAASAQGTVTMLPPPGPVSGSEIPPQGYVIHSPNEIRPMAPSVEVAPLPPVPGAQMSVIEPLPGTAQQGPTSLPAEPQAATATPDSWPADSTTNPATQALNDLEGAGYGVFYDFHSKGTGFEATVVQNGRPMNVFIDPLSGSVTPQY